MRGASLHTPLRRTLSLRPLGRELSHTSVGRITLVVSRDVLGRVLLSQPYLKCLLEEFATFSYPVDKTGELADVDDEEWTLEMPLQGELGMGWLPLSTALKVGAGEAKAIFKKVNQRRDAAAEKIKKERRGSEEELNHLSETGGSADTFALSEFFEAALFSAVKSDPYFQPPVDKTRFEKCLTSWLETALVPHARAVQEQLTDLEDVLLWIRDDATDDVERAFEQLQRVHDKLFDRFREKSEAGGEGVSLPSFMAMAKLVYQPRKAVLSTAGYTHAVRKAFVGALPQTLLHRPASEAKRLLRRPTFKDAVLRLCFLLTNLAYYEEQGMTPKTVVELLRRPEHLGVAQLQSLQEVMTEAARAPTPRVAAARRSNGSAVQGKTAML
jgi:hypothetical protein